MDYNIICDELIKLSKKSLRYGDVPVGAIIVKDGKIISKSYNTREKKKLVINHAEINAILKANKKLKNKFLYGCDLFVTLKPCSMCENIIKQSRINKVFYMIDKPLNKKEYNRTTINKIDSDLDEKYASLIQQFFNKIRKWFTNNDIM